MQNGSLNFSRRDLSFFIGAILFLSAGFIAMAIDPADNGFGVLTLWIAPPLLLIGFALPIVGILGLDHFASLHLLKRWKASPLKHAVGALAFVVAFAIYLLTLEPTASLWDCSEFIASAFKLQVPHTPGTPLALLVARMFTMLSFGDVKQVAWTINMMSGLFSALTVWVVYYIIHYLILSLTPAHASGRAIILAALGGSLCLAFSDSFWYSAVEAETYAAACFCLALLVWLILKGKDQPEPARGRWLVLVAYVAGLAYCIHPMCLLALPVLPFAWYTKDRAPSYKNIIVASGAGFLIVFLINRLVAVGLFELAFSFDFFFVNTLHFAFYSGVAVLLVLMTAIVYFLLRRFSQRAHYTWSVVFLVAGFLPYLMLFIRSGHNPPIDETNPENLYMVKAYMNRESYPTSPLAFGPYFDANIEEFAVKSKAYVKGKNEYELSGPLVEYKYEPSRQTILPRLYSNDPDHTEAYRNWLGLRADEKPRFSDNVKFMFTAQLGHMYFRYFLFNFAGRESDVQGSGTLMPWDSLKLGGSHPNPARNQYWMLPLLAGVLGLLYQYKKDPKGFFSVVIFFLITGVILALYLNSPPVEPRERDYIYVGSYMAFCLWVGIGFFVVGNFFTKPGVAWIVTAGFSVLLPAWLCYQNYNDHNRSGRTFQVDYARNTLMQCAPNAILFTGGDNDTFPLWYVQEVEGFRTDVRVMVLSYFNTDWYIGQLTKRYYDSTPFKLTLSDKAYRQYGPNDVLYIQESIKGGIDAKKYLELLNAEHAGLRVMTGHGDSYNIVPSRILTVKTEHNDSAVQNMLTASSHQTAVVAPGIQLKLTENYMQKNVLALLDLIVSNGWERPLYFNFTSLNTLGLDVKPYVVQEGSLFRLQPKPASGKAIAVDKDLCYKNLIEDADYSNLANPDVYFNYEDFQARMVVPIRQTFNTLAEAYFMEGDTTRAGKVLQLAVGKLYPDHLLPSYTNLQAAEMLTALGRDAQAQRLAASLFQYAYDEVQEDRRTGKRNELNLFLLSKSSDMMKDMGKADYAEKLRALGM
ncbi:glycosyltransferase family 117 protein [Chryseolinea lacunae]|uniref:DUF2723 domain-containing protein n=1 Tax=Chryseolinea lacunae TaxID=2801331 RepID=A0ABS1KUU0_9BACT|nr:DUF2723 domain-containing protein [Chryseolinea lacunae]MBL0743134.1 DUF2723 domain-containing protein [Chryseolinea lacunae]